MQKPEYIKINISIGNYYAKKLFCNFVNYLKNRNAVLNFASERKRKKFDYKIIDSKIIKRYNLDSNIPDCDVEITLEKIIN